LIPFRLKRADKLTSAGGVFAAAMIVFALFVAHSATIRYHEVLGQRDFDSVRLALDRGDATLPADAIRSAIRHLTAARQWGLFRPRVRDQQLASLHLKSSAPALAEPYLRRIVLAEPLDTDSRLALANLLTVSGRTEEADEQTITAYRMTAVADATNVPARMTLGQILADSGRYREAAETFREVTSLEPDLAVARFNLAAALQNAGDAEGAVEAYEETLALLPDDVETLVNLGFLLADRGELAAAAGHFQRTVELQPGHARAHFNLAVVRHEQGDLERADEHYRRAAELDPRYAAKLR
jgi:tetratricopeptide (TPR) repeat protein